MRPRLRCTPDVLSEYASRYSYPEDDSVVSLNKTIGKRGYLLKSELLTIARWKSPRSAGHAEKNQFRDVEEITRFAFSASSERARIESLTILDGVEWPTASVLLHLYHKDPYPILDFRALWSISLTPPSQYFFEFWWKYTTYFRELICRTGMGKRELDRGLWQYSKENQKSNPRKR